VAGVNAMSLKDFAKSLPHPLKPGLKYVYGAVPPRFRYGKVFWRTYNLLQESQWWGREKLEEYQMRQLEELLKRAYENVPYYRRAFDERGLKPKDIGDFDDLKKLPYLTKDIVRENLSDLIATNYPKLKLQSVTTGGSTNTPVRFYHEIGVSKAKEEAFILTLWNRVGFKMGDSCVVLRGHVVISTNKRQFSRYDPVSRNLVLSSYHMDDERLPKYIDKIRQFRPDFIQAYPSTLTILARFMKQNAIDPFSTVRAVLCGSENLYAWQRKYLEEVFRCRIYSWYGHAERAVLAGGCERSTYYHIFPEYGIVELIGKDGKPATRDGEIGEVVATSLNSFVCPFIRYRTMDLAVRSNSKCSCGRNYSLIERIEGRVQEFVVSKGGALVPHPLHFGWIRDGGWKRIKQIQFIQEKEGEIVIEVVRNTSYPERETESHILRLYRPKFEGLCDLSVRFVDHIPRTVSGKYRFLIQKVPIEWGN